MLRYVMRLNVPLATEFEKKNHGTSAAYAKSGYGTPSDGIFATRENTMVKTIIAASGCTIAHAMPKNDWLYRPLTSRLVRFISSSRYAERDIGSARADNATTLTGVNRARTPSATTRRLAVSAALL